MVGYIHTTNPGGLSTAKMVSNMVPFADTQGIYLKINSDHANWEVMQAFGYSSTTRSNWDSLLAEIQTVNAGKGFQIEVSWGLYEKGASGGDFSNLQYLKTVCDEVAAIGKYVVLELANFREFRNSNVKNLPLIDQMRYLLPVDMHTQTGMVDSVDVLTSLGKTIHATTGTPSGGLGVNGDYAHDPATNILYGPKASGAWPAGVDLDTSDPRAHYLWDYAYAYDKALNDNFGYDLKTWNATLQARFARFCRAVCDVLGNHPAVVAISSTESVDGSPMYIGAGGYDSSTGASRPNFFAGKTAMMDSINGMFKRQMVMQSCNFPNDGVATSDPYDYVAEWYNAAPDKKYSITAPNSNWWVVKLNRAGNASYPKGANRYFADHPGPKWVQIQGDECDSLVSGAPQISSTADYLQRYIDLYQRVTVGDGADKFALNATHLIIQREHPQGIWLGGTTNNIPNVPNGVVVPSLKSFFNNPAYVPQDGKAGLGSSTVAYIT